MSDINWKKIGQSIASAAPVLGGILTGPAGMAVTAAGALASAVLGVDNSPAAVEQAIKADPEALVKLRQAEMDHKVKLEELVLQREQLAYTDMQDARKRDVEVRTVSKTHNNLRADILSIGALCGLVALIWTLLFVTVPDGPARDVLLILSGALVAIVKDVYSFEFGSSRGSKEKDTIMAGAKK
jgi:hypothetical protein